MAEQPCIADQLSARVVVASTRAAAGEYQDRTGPLIVSWLGDQGYRVDPVVVVADGEPVAAAIRAAVHDQVGVLITTGGTGITPTDRTPEATRAVLDYEIPGIGEAVRNMGLPSVPTALLSRGVAGVAGRTLVVNLPGSTGGVRDGLAVLSEVLSHAIAQIRGGDHEAGAHDGVSPEQASAAFVARAVITESPLSLDEHVSLVARAQAGAVATFSGVVRDHDRGRAVRELEYVSHPSAQEALIDVAVQVACRPGIRAVAVSHRLGLLGIGDLALACALSADHRQAAFLACAELVDQVKARLPIWKRQVFADGSEEWVNCP